MESLPVFAAVCLVFGAVVISGGLVLLLPLVIAIGAGARAVARRVTPPTRG